MKSTSTRRNDEARAMKAVFASFQKKGKTQMKYKKKDRNRENTRQIIHLFKDMVDVYSKCFDENLLNALHEEDGCSSAHNNKSRWDDLQSPRMQAELKKMRERGLLDEQNQPTSVEGKRLSNNYKALLALVLRKEAGLRNYKSIEKLWDLDWQISATTTKMKNNYKIGGEERVWNAGYDKTKYRGRL